MLKLVYLALIVGFLMDCVLGDPAALPHPVVLIGKGISLCEKLLRPRFPQTDRGQITAGAVMVVIMIVLSGAVSFGILTLCWLVNRWLFFAVCCVMSWQILAARCLQQEAEKVHDCLKRDDLPAARYQVSMLVGRDTAELTARQVTKATVETVAENSSDGVIAPMFWMLLLGPVGGFMYKAVNTMDSMVGYKNEKYLYFGRAGAKTDDAANYLPARVSALCMIAAAAILPGFSGRNAAKIWKRDRRKHASPNSAQTESVCAGALGVQLAGSASYFGKVLEKPFIGDDLRPIEPEDITRSCRLMYGASVIWLILGEAIVWGIQALC